MPCSIATFGFHPRTAYSTLPLSQAAAASGALLENVYKLPTQCELFWQTMLGGQSLSTLQPAKQ